MLIGTISFKEFMLLTSETRKQNKSMHSKIIVSHDLENDFMLDVFNMAMSLNGRDICIFLFN
jgi:hypothetical protein